jgi:hypothetical protein
MKRMHVVISLGVVAALAVAVPVLALSNGVSPPIKKAIKKEVARQIAAIQLSHGAEGKQGPEGKQGAQGVPGTPDTSKFFEKTESDARYVQGNPGGSASTAVYTHHIVLSNTGAFANVLNLPGGMEVKCASNDSTASYAKIESPNAFVGSLSYNEGTGTFINAGVYQGAATAAFGSAVYGTAQYQIMDSDGSTAPNRVLTITVTVLRNSAHQSGGPHCLAEAVVGPA